MFILKSCYSCVVSVIREQDKTCLRSYLIQNEEIAYHDQFRNRVGSHRWIPVYTSISIDNNNLD